MGLRSLISRRNQIGGGNSFRTDLYFDKFGGDLDIKQCAGELLGFCGFICRWNEVGGFEFIRLGLYLDEFGRIMDIKQRAG